jgi:hypothetical protein
MRAIVMTRGKNRKNTLLMMIYEEKTYNEPAALIFFSHDWSQYVSEKKYVSEGKKN